MMIETKYLIGQHCYVITDSDQRVNIVTALLIRPGGISYELSSNGVTKWFYDFEISEEKNVLTKVTQ